MWIRAQSGTLLNTAAVNSFTVRDVAKFPSPNEASAALAHVVTAERRSDAVPLTGAVDHSTAQSVLDALGGARRSKCAFFDVREALGKSQSEAI